MKNKGVNIADKISNVAGFICINLVFILYGNMGKYENSFSQMTEQIINSKKNKKMEQWLGFF